MGYIEVITNLQTIDPHFLGHPSSGEPPEKKNSFSQRFEKSNLLVFIGGFGSPVGWPNPGYHYLEDHPI